MPTCRHEQIMAVVLAQLASIAGAEYFHPVDVAVRTPSFHGELLGKLPNGTDPAVRVFVCPDRTNRRKDTSKRLKGEILFDVVAVKRFPASPTTTENPYTAPAPIRETVQAELVHDVEKKLISDPTYQAYQGLEVYNVEVTLDDRSPEETNIEGWATAFLRVLIHYQYRPEAP